MIAGWELNYYFYIPRLFYADHGAITSLTMILAYSSSSLREGEGSHRTTKAKDKVRNSTRILSAHSRRNHGKRRTLNRDCAATWTWAESWYELLNPINSFAWDESWRAVAYTPMTLFEHAEQPEDGLDVFGSGIPRRRNSMTISNLLVVVISCRNIAL